MRITLEFKPQDCWVGVYWRRHSEAGWYGYDVWLCILPMVPLHLSWTRHNPAAWKVH